MDSRSLTRRDLHYVASIRRPTLRVLSSSSTSASKKQKVVIGDDSGTLTCFSYQRAKGEIEIKWKTTPFKREISGLCVENNEFIYVSVGQTVHGLTKSKGQTCFSMITSLSDDLIGIVCTSNTLYTATSYAVNRYDRMIKSNEVKEGFFYQSKEKINVFDAVQFPKANSGMERVFVLIACADKTIRVLNDNADEPSSEFQLDGPVSVLFSRSSLTSTSCATVSPKSPFTAYSEGFYCDWIYGTEWGEVGMFRLFSNGKLVHLSVLPIEKVASSITSLALVDYLQDGTLQLLLSRDDGFLQLYSLGAPTTTSGFSTKADGTWATPAEGMTPIFSINLHETVYATDIGYVLAPPSANSPPDIICVTFSGKIIAFSSSDRDDESGAQVVGAAAEKTQEKEKNSFFFRSSSKKKKEKKQEDDPQSELVSGNMRMVSNNIQSEITALQDKVSKEKERFSKQFGMTFQEYSSNNATATASSPASSSDMTVKSNLSIRPQQQCLQLLLESRHPFEMVILQFINVDIEVVQTDDETKDQAPIQVSKCRVDASADDDQQQSQNPPSTSTSYLSSQMSSISSSATSASSPTPLLYLLQSSDPFCSRMNFSFRPTEGILNGELNVWIITKKHSGKLAQKATFQILPCSLHERISYQPIPSLPNSFGRLTFSGNFSSSICFQWISQLFPLSSTIASLSSSKSITAPSSSTFSYGFQSILLGTMVYAEGSPNTLLIATENPIILSIIKDFVSRLATQTKIPIQSSTDITIECLEYYLSKIQPIITSLFEWEKRIQIQAALSELKLQDEGWKEYFEEEYGSLLSEQNVAFYKRMTDQQLTEKKQFWRNNMVELLEKWCRLQGKTLTEQRRSTLERVLNSGLFDWTEWANAIIDA